jgi:hypothetical protein
MRWVVTVVIAGALGCIGEVTGGVGQPFGPGPSLGGVAGGQSGSGVAGGDSSPSAMGVTVLHRLSQAELRNVLTEALDAQAARSLPDLKDPLVFGLDTNADALTVSASTVDSMFETAKAIASKVTPASLGTCAQGMAERACAQQRIAKLALQLLRRPATQEDLTSYLMLWDAVQAREGATVATQAVVERLLMTPDFLYHVQIGDPTTGKLNDFEMAARLSFLTWESLPDQALFDAAAAGTLTTPAGVQVQLERLLKDAKAQRTMRRFFELWSDLAKLDDLTKDPSVYSGFAALKAPMREEFSLFMTDLLDRNGTLRELLTSRTGFVDAELASLYGVTPPTSGTSKVTLPADRAAGLLTQGAFLAIHGKAQRSGPILRGLFVRERLLCAAVPPPPPGVSATVPPGTVTNRTTREYFHTLTAGQDCQGCHRLINPIGFSFEGFDGVGRARSIDNGLPVDTRVDVIGSGSIDGTYTNVAELAQRLADAPEVQACVARSWFRSRFRRREVGDDERVISRAVEAMVRENGKLSALAASLSREEALLYAHFRVPEGP